MISGIRSRTSFPRMLVPLVMPADLSRPARPLSPLVEVYTRLMTHLAKDGLGNKGVTHEVYPSSTSGRVDSTFYGASGLPTRKPWRR